MYLSYGINSAVLKCIPGNWEFKFHSAELPIISIQADNKTVISYRISPNSGSLNSTHFLSQHKFSFITNVFRCQTQPFSTFTGKYLHLKFYCA